jgi:hypothetical protein
VITVLYPDLKNRGLSLIIEDGTRLDNPASPTSFDITVLDPKVLDPKTGLSVCTSWILSTRFQFPTTPQDARIYSFSANGAVVGRDELEKLNSLVDAHPEWSDVQVLEALTKAGAEFAPAAKDRFIQALPMAGLELLLGKFRVVSMNFSIRDEEQLKQHLASSMLLWEADLETEKPSRGHRKYYALFEPFRGRLVSLTARSLMP